jgi:outer membrane protein assembly factor BamB
MDGVSRRQVLAGFGGVAAAGWSAARWAARGRAPGTLIWRRPAAGTGNLIVSILAGYGLVYESGDLDGGDPAVYGISEATGTLVWQKARVEGSTAGPGAVYCFSGTGSDVVAMEAATGRALWTHDDAFPIGNPTDYYSLTYASERVYFACGGLDVTTTTPSSVGALDARTGRSLWAVTLTAHTQQPAATDNAVYASTVNGAVALNARTGAQLWKSDDMEGNPGTLIAADDIICGNTASARAAIGLDAATGSVLWRTETGWLGTADGGIIFAVSDASDGPGVQALDARSGKLIWSRTLPLNASMGLGVVAASGVAYVSGSGSELLALSATTGRTLWGYHLVGGVSSVAVDAGIVLASDSSGALYALQA